MRIPEVGKRMREIAVEIQKKCPVESAELLRLAAELRRRSGSRAPITSVEMTPELADEIRDYEEQNPGMSQQAIANTFGVNHGRVSEVLKGKRT